MMEFVRKSGFESGCDGGVSKKVVPRRKEGRRGGNFVIEIPYVGIYNRPITPS